MAKTESPSSHISKSLSLLKEQEEEYQSIINSASLKDHILSLKLGLPFLEQFLSVSNNEDLKMRIRRVVYNVRRELHSLSNKPTEGSLILELDHAYTNLREKMKNVIINSETREYDVIFPKLYSSDGDLRKINDFLLNNFGDLPSCKADLITHSMKEMGGIKEKLILLQSLLTYVADTGVYIKRENKKLLTPLVDVLDKTACLIYSCLVDKMDEEMAVAMKRKLSNLLENINVKEIYLVVLRASTLFESTDNPLESEFYLLDNLIKLLDSNASSVLYLNDPSEKLHDKLKLLKNFLANLPHEQIVEKFNYLVTTIKTITWKSIPVLYSCYDEDMKEDMEVNGALSEVLDQIEHIQEVVREMKLYNYPKTDVLGFLDLLLGHLEELLKCRPQLIETLKNQIETLNVEFDFLRSFLRTIKERHHEHEELEDLWTRIVRLAYQAEYVIDFYLVKSVPDSGIMFSLSNIIEQTKLIQLEVRNVYDKENYHSQGHDAAKTFPSQAIGTTTDVVVGFEDEAEKIMEYLVGYQKQLDVVSIVGMPGLGKTTIANKIYEAPSIVEHFDVRAWCSVSQTFRKRELLLTILDDVIGVNDEINRLSDEELAAKLYKSLRGHRYLIVIDDMWDIMAWDDLIRSFPDDKMHSRILITSRVQIVDSQTKVGSKVHTLRLFSDDESWELLQKKLFQKESFSEDFLKVGKQIAQRCKGLPLAIVVIAGLLAKVEKDISKWKEIEVSLISHILSDSEMRCMAIFNLSYNHLPDHLKSCFLYIGAFVKEKEIPVWKLKWLWIAEGFVRDTEEKNLEYVAEEYFMDLINRSLVTATKERSLEGVKACRVHDLLRDFCLEKAKEESFLQVIHVDNWSKFSRVYDQRRLSIYSEVYDLMKAKPSGYSVRSLLHTAAKKNPFHQDISFISQNFKLLRVLDATWINIGESFSGIDLLIHLRYLAIRAETTSIPSSIANLWNLQSFLVKADTNYSKELVDVPDSLWDMVNLRHVHISYSAFFNVHSRRLENSSLLDNLETLSTPCLSYGEDAENLLRRLPKLRKLRCVFLDCWDNSTNSCQFPVLNFLSQLMSLKVFFEGSLHWGKECVFNLPLNLQKLTLSKFRLLWDDISKIGRAVPNLKVLKLIGSDWSEKWNVNDGDFPKLKYLKLSDLKYLSEWIASEDSFPILEQLVLDNCGDLKEIPHCFGDTPTLTMITVKDCKPSVDDSARRIQMEQQEELQNAIRVYIYPRKLKFYSCMRLAGICTYYKGLLGSRMSSLLAETGVLMLVFLQS